MSSSDLVRWGGVAAVVAGVSYLVLVLFSLQGLGSSLSFSLLANSVFIVALLSQLVWVAGLHTLQREHHGRLGTVGSVLAAVGFVLLPAAVLVSGLEIGIVAAVLFFVGVLTSYVGLVLLGVAALRARVLTRWFGILLIVSAPIGLVLTLTVGGAGEIIVLVVFWVLVGYALLSSGGAKVRQPTRVE